MDRATEIARRIGSPIRATTARRSDGDYHSRFENWHLRATVRVEPERVLTGTGPDTLYFPPELLPLMRHPLVAARDEREKRRVLVHRLYDYLHFTTELEQVAVIPVASVISRGRSGVDLPPTMRRDAYRILTDEAWHAQFSDDLIRQVERQTGIAAPGPYTPQFVHALREIGDRLDPAVRPLQDLVFAIVSETLISATLVRLPRDERLPSAVRELVADHAEDEGKHHAYFRALLSRLWPTLTERERHLIGRHLPDMIAAFLEPDYRALAYALGDVGFGFDAVRQILVESYPLDVVQRDLADAASASIRGFAVVGVLDSPAIHAAFEKAGLLGHPAGALS